MHWWRRSRLCRAGRAECQKAAPTPRCVNVPIDDAHRVGLVSHSRKATVIITEVVRHLLMRAPAKPLCDACLAYACDTSDEEMGSVTDSIIEADRAFQRGSVCAGCGDLTPTIFYRVGRAGLDTIAS
jgi:hypothetical protein